MTEQELIDVGREPYLEFLWLIKSYLIRPHKEKSLGPDRLLIPGPEIVFIKKLKFEETINLLIKDFVLIRFPYFSSLQYEARVWEHDYDKSNWPEPKGPDEFELFNLIVGCQMSVVGLDQYIAEIRAVGNKESGETNAGEDLINVSPPQFNAEMSRLTFRGKDIQISKKEYSAPNRLLRALLLLGTPQRRWNYDEIWEEGQFGEGEYDPKKDMQSIYQAARDVNDKVYKATHVESFLEFNTSTVMVNPVNIH